MCILLGKRINKWLLAAVLLLNIGLHSSAQTYPVRIDITVMPPYTSSLADYIHTPNKIVANISSLDMRRDNTEIYLKGSIKSDGGIEIKTSESFKPSSSILLSRGMVYSLTSSDISEMFDVNKLDITGIDLNNLVNGAGLPEDNYQICIRAYDYYTNQPVSDEEPIGCSNYFLVTNFEPPIITIPVCGDSVNIQPFQNVLVSWTTPPGVIGVQYKFEMIEIPAGMHINPNNAFQSSAFPPLFEETVSVNVINLTTGKVLLSPGYIYAFRVQAFDPANKQYFRNSGYSEVCHIVCKEEQNSNVGNLVSAGNIEDFEEQFKLIPNTVISGRLLAKFPEDPSDGVTILPENFGKSPQVIMDAGSMNPETSIPSNLTGQQETKTKNYTNKQSQGYSYSKVSETASSIMSNSNINTTSHGNVALESSGIIGGGMVQVTRKPYYFYEQTEEIVNTKPLANMEIKLVARFGVNNGIFPQYRDPYTGELIMEFKDLNGENRNPYNILNVVLATATTDESGNFTFNFTTDFFTGTTTVKSMGAGHFEEDIYEVNPLDKLGWGMDEVFPGTDFDAFEGLMNQQFDGSFNQGLGDVAGQQSNTQHQTMSYTPGESSLHPAFLCLKIEVVNQKFCSPDIDIYAMPGDILEVPVQVAKLKTYNLTVTPTSSNDDYQIVKKNTPMENVRVHVFRDMQTAGQELDMILNFEGQRLKTQTVNEKGTLKDVAIDTTAIENGSVHIKNLVNHAYFNPQYFIEVSTRNLNEADNDYEFTLYNYKTVYDELETKSENDATNPSNSPFGGNQHVMYNRYYVIPEITYTPVMVPHFPEIKGRAMALTNLQNTAMSNVRVQLFNEPNINSTYASGFDFQLKAATNSQINQESEILTNEFGFFSFSNLNLLVSGGSVTGPYRRVLLTSPGYQSVVRPVHDFMPMNLKRGMLADFKDINMEPARLLEGYIVDEDGNPVSAYIKSECSPFYTTETRLFNGAYHQFFEVPSVLIGKTLLTIHPKSGQFFECDTLVNYSTAVKAKITVYKKLHRPIIVVTKADGTPLPGTKITLGEETPKMTDNDGTARFKYASPGNQVIIKITPPAGYAPVQEPIDIPVTRHDTIFTFVLEKAKTINGVVKEKVSQNPIQGATIYSELQNTDGTILYVEAVSGQDGRFTLSGIPESYTSVEVFAVKMGNNPAYVGASKTINFSQQSQIVGPVLYSFELKRMDDWDLSSIWGYPVVLNAMRPVKTKPDEFFIDGYFYNPPLTEGFSLQQPDVKLAFSYLQVKKSASGKIEPVNSNIELDINKIPLVVNQTFSGILYHHKQVPVGQGAVYNTYGLHKIVKEGTKATLQGILKLNLSSFNFAYNFSGELYAGEKNLGNKVESFSKVIPTTQVQDNIGVRVQSETQAQAVNQTGALQNILLQPRLEIFSLNSSFQPSPVKNYEVFGFRATSNPEGSYLMNDKIFIKTILHTDIPMCNSCPKLDLNINAGNIIITKNDINLVKTPHDTLNFELERWKVYNRKEWEFDKNEDAIVLKEALIVTGKGIDVRIKNLKIRSSWIGEGEIDLSGGGLNLGGVANIELNSDLKPIFNFDVTGHYRISMVGTTSAGKPAGIVQQLPAMKNGDRIKFQSIGLLSNGADILTINQKILLYNILELEVSQIVSGDGYFKLQGSPDLDIPNFIPEPAIMEYRLNTQGKITAMPPVVGGRIDATGYVTFKLDTESQIIQDKIFKSFGKLTVHPGAGSDSDPRAFSFRAELTRIPNECRIDLKVDNTGGSQLQNFIAGSNVIKVYEGSMNTINNNTGWNYLSYKGKTSEIEGMNKPGADNVLTFTVNGAIEASSSSLQVSNIDVGLGSMTLTYDFDNSRLHGNLLITNVDLGYAYLKQGQLSVLLDNNGYYLSGRAYADILHLFPAECGFIFGNSSQVDPADAKSVVHNFHSQYKPNLGTIEGFYFIGELRVIDKTAKTPLDILKVNLQAGMGSYFQGSLTPNDKKIKIGGYIYGDAWGGISVKICSAGVGAYIHGETSGTYYLDTHELNLYSCTMGGIRVSACGIGTSFDFHVDAEGSYNGGLKLNMDYGWSKCP